MEMNLGSQVAAVEQAYYAKLDRCAFLVGLLSECLEKLREYPHCNREIIAKIEEAFKN